MKFEVTSFNTFEVMRQTRFRDAQTDGLTDVHMDRQTDRQGDSNDPGLKKPFENSLEKGENAGNQHFLPYAHSFLFC